MFEEVPQKRVRGEREDAAFFTRHSAASYNTLGRIKKSDNPRAAVDRENQETPDLTEAGVKLAREKAETFFSRLNPDADTLFFVSSDEARALETANVYRQAAKEKGFQIITPEHVRGSFAEQVGEGQIRTLDTLSLSSSDALLASVFAPDSQLGSPNWSAVDDEFKEKWAKARAIINSHDFGSFGANLFHHSEEIAKIFPEVKTSKELYDSKFKRLVKLAEFGINKAKESGSDKNIKILAFGHENYMGYALDKYFAEHNIGNCETIDLSIDQNGAKFISKKGDTKELKG